MLEPTIAPTVSAIVSASVVPPIVNASVSNVPSTSTSPEISNDGAMTSCVNVTLPSDAIAIASVSEV